MFGVRDTNNCDHYTTDVDWCAGHCHPSGTGCRGAATRRADGYYKVAENKFDNQTCSNGIISGTKKIPERMGACSIFTKK
jgi:hypothetical protein